eukprot:484332-Prymnesium_polylepis.1
MGPHTESGCGAAVCAQWVSGACALVQGSISSQRPISCAEEMSPLSQTSLLIGAAGRLPSVPVARNELNASTMASDEAALATGPPPSPAGSSASASRMPASTSVAAA